MSKEEKILALELILKDIRGNWGWGLEERVDMALNLSIRLSKDNKEYLKMVESINDFKEDMKTKWCDGRHFRTNFPRGYEGMSKIHGLKNTYKDKSKGFKTKMKCLTYPEYIFSDWK